MELDQWQKDVLSTDGNIVLRSGRQCGKSTIISILAAEYAVKNEKKSIMIISATERQAYLLFSKVLFYIDENFKKYMKTGKDRPTKSEIKLKNGSIIRCLPTGLDGLGIRGYTIDMLIADEAAFIPEDVYPAIIPALVTNNGRIILISTPFGKAGHFYKCFQDPTFTKFHISTEEVAEGRSGEQRTAMLAFLEQQKKTMTHLQYAQEFLGEFVDELLRMFSDDLIKKVCTLKRQNLTGKKFLGVDVGGMGEDISSYEEITRVEDKFYQTESITSEKTYINDVTTIIQHLHAKNRYKKIYVDDGGIGFGVFSNLLYDSRTKKQVVALNNARRSLNRDETQQKRILKEDLYMNFLSMLEQGILRLLDDEQVINSLRSVQREFIREDGKPTKSKIYGNDTHIVEGLIRAAWSNQDKTLNIWAANLVHGYNKFRY